MKPGAKPYSMRNHMQAGLIGRLVVDGLTKDGIDRALLRQVFNNYR